MIENEIFSNLVNNHEYFARVIPHLREDYFEATSDQILLRTIREYSEKYKGTPSKTAIKLVVDKMKSISESDYDEIMETVDGMKSAPEDLEFLVNETEEFCQRQAMYNALSESLKIKTNFDKPHSERDDRVKEIGAIPEIMRDALAVCFDTSVGLDFFEDWKERWDFYSKKTSKIPFGIQMMNTITQGGVERGTLNIILAGVNVGKSLALCHLAADYLVQGLNVLYISMEMSEEATAKRIDANLIDINMDDFETLGVGTYERRLMAKREQVGNGKLIIKQYPTASAHVGHFNSLLTELKNKKDFIPDVVLVDYLGIMASSRIRGGSDNSYLFVKSIAEELRGFAVEHKIAVWSAAQTTRGAWGASDIGMEDTAESAGLPATADFMIAVMETEELMEMGQQRVKQIKSRYGDKSQNSSFMIAVDKGKQRWSDIVDTPFTQPGESYNPDQKAKTAGGFSQNRKKPDYGADPETGEIPKEKVNW